MFGLDNLVDMLFDSAMENLSRNERVIQLLKRLKLDPDHPPADFAGVYQYALVEYGVGKPRPALEIFRQSEIQQLFREALEQNNPSKLLQHGEAFLSDHPLQTDLQASNVDVRREFYAFAAVFIEVAKRTRTPAEMLAEQKLASLHRQIGTVQERLNRLPTIEGMRTEMARLVAPAYPALPEGESFGAEQCKAVALAQQMRGWFETLGFRLETHEVWHDDYVEWIINIPVRRGRYDRILVRGIDGEAGLRDVEALKQSVETHRTDEGWLVTARRISRAARDEIEKPENDGIGCYTLDELLDQDADFSGYLTWLEAEIQKRGIAEKYVPLACLKEELDPDTKQRLGVSRYDDRDGWIDGYIDLWLDDPAKEHISVLGEFGTGKTWFALHYAWQALQRYREAQRRGLERPRLPLIIPLRDYAKAVSVESLFSEFFFRKHEIPIPGYSAFEQLNRMGKLLLIFDGFDEMAARVDRQEMINNFWELAKVVVPGAKVILTCRTEHFPEAREGRALLNAELQASTRDLTGETPQFEVLELEKFNDGQIRQVLTHQAQPATVEQIMGNPQLLDLARRPVLTELILEALPDIEAGKPVDMSRVYLYAVRHKMERDIKEERTFTSMADKLYFMCELSWEMLSTDRMSINYREFPDRIRKLFGSAVEDEKDLDHWHYDMMGQTMLIRNAEGDYAPAHRSLLEFFVAYKFAAELGVLAHDFLKVLEDHGIVAPGSSKASNDYTWSSFFQGTIETRKREVSSLSDFLPEELNKLHESIGKQPLSKALKDLILPMIDKSQHSLLLLKESIKKTGREKVQKPSYLGGNVATIVVKLDSHAFENEDFSQANIIAADFSSASLLNTDFSSANLEKTNFIKALGGVWSIAVSPRSELLATGDSDYMIRLWDVSTGTELSALEGHEHSVRSIAFSHDGKILASGSSDKTVRIWDVHDGKCLHVLKEHNNQVLCVAFTEPGVLASCGSDHTIKLWDIASGSCIGTLQGHKNWVYKLAYSKRTKLLASGGSDKTIRLWRIDKQTCEMILEGHSKIIRALIFNDNNETLISGGDDGKIRVWDIKTGSCLKVVEAHSENIPSLAINQNQGLLVSCSGDQSIKLWDIHTMSHIKSLLGHKNWIWSVEFSSNGKLVFSGSSDKTVKIWDVKTGESINTIHGYMGWIESVKFSPSGNLLASASDDGSVKIWNVAENQCISSLKGHENWVESVDFSYDGKYLASCSSDETIKVWNTDDFTCRSTFHFSDGWVESLAFHPQKYIIVSASFDGKVRVWDIASEQCVMMLEGHQGGLRSVLFSPNGKFIASASTDETIRIWNSSTGELIRILSGHSRAVYSIAFSPIRSVIASGSADGSIKIWDFESGNCIKTIYGLEGWIYDLSFNPKLNLLASVSSNELVCLWDLETGECLKSFEGFSSSVDFSPDGLLLAVGCGYDTIGIIDIKSFEYLKTLGSRIYEGMNISNVKGLTAAEKTALKSLGAIEA